MKIFLTLVVALAGAWTCAQADERAPFPLDSIDQRVQTCTPCHGKEGRSTGDAYYPRIAGKPAGYLYNQLLNFRDGRRHFPVMRYLTERQQEPYLQEIAAYFAAQHPPFAAPKTPQLPAAALERGRMLVTDGDPAREIPACSACHGARLMGIKPAVPGLLGLPYDYVVAQLGAWRNGTRRAHAPDCMAQIVKRLSDQDLAATAAWVATQTPPADLTPDATFERQPPIACGSIQSAERAE